jgi:hypothetical protein
VSARRLNAVSLENFPTTLERGESVSLGFLVLPRAIPSSVPVVPGRKMCQTALKQTEHVLPSVPLRQWVFHAAALDGG